MARRFNSRYFLDLGSDRDFKLSASEWHELRAGGWIKPDAPGAKYAKPRSGVLAWVRGGDLYLLALAGIRTVSASWARAWLYSGAIIPTAIPGESLFELQERAMFDEERDRQNEALMWRTFRNTKGANEFCWIPAEAKREIIAALRSDLAAV